MNLVRGLVLLLGLVLASQARAMEVKEITTPLGLKVWLVEDKSAPVVALSFSFGGGSARDSEAQKGLTSLTASLLTDGAGSLDAQAFKRREEEAAASLGFGASLDRVSGSLRLLSANPHRGLRAFVAPPTPP